MSKLTFFQDYFIQDFRKNCPDVSIGGSKAKDTAENVLQSKMQGQLKSDDLAVISNKECAEYVWVNVLLNDFKVINDLKQLADQLGITTQLKTNIDAYTNYLYTSRGDIPAKDVSSFIQRWGEVLELGFKPDAVFGWKYSGSSQEQEDSKNAAFVTLTLPIPSLEASVNLATLKGMVKRATKDLQDNFHALTQLRVVTDHSIMKILNNDNKADVTQYNNLLEQIKLLNTNPVSIETKLNGLNQTLYEDGKTFLGVNASTALKKALRNDKLIGETSEYQATAASSADAPESGVVEQMLKAARKNDESLRSQATPGQPTDSADAPESGVVEQMLKAARKKADDKGNNGSSDSWYDKLNLFPSSSSESQEKPTQKVVGVGLSQIGGEIRANFYNGIFKFIKTASIASQDSTLKSLSSLVVSGGVPTSDLLEKLQEKIEEKDESYSKMVIKLATALIMPKAIGVAEKMFAEFPKLMKVPGNSCFYGQSSEGQIISIEYSDVSAASYKAKVDDPVKTPAGCVEGHGTAFEMLTAVEVNEYSIDYSSDL